MLSAGLAGSAGRGLKVSEILQVESLRKGNHASENGRQAAAFLGVVRTFNVNALSNYTCPTTAPPCASPSKVYYDEMPEGLVAPGLTVTVPPATPAPGVSTPTATGVTRISAQVSGTITPNGLRTTYYFEYTDTPSSDTWKRTSSVTIAAASG